jgi:hypothetical protein
MIDMVFERCFASSQSLVCFLITIIQYIPRSCFLSWSSNTSLFHLFFCFSEGPLAN